MARAYLSQKSPSYLGGIVLHTRQLQANWARLTGVVRTGRAPQAVESEEGDTFTLAEYCAWLLAAGFDRVRTLQAPSSSPLILASR